MPTYRRRERVVFLKDVNKNSFGVVEARKGDIGVVSSWSRGGWLKVRLVATFSPAMDSVKARLDRHGAIVSVRTGPCIGPAVPPALTKQSFWSKEAQDEANLVVQQMRSIHSKTAGLEFCVRSAISEKKTVNVELIESTRLELERAAQMLLKLSFSLPTQISPFPTKSFGALQSRGSTPSPVMVPDESSKGEAVERVDARAECTQLFG
jgi:hypothetical protein